MNTNWIQTTAVCTVLLHISIHKDHLTSHVLSLSLAALSLLSSLSLLASLSSCLSCPLSVMLFVVITLFKCDDNDTSSININMDNVCANTSCSHKHCIGDKTHTQQWLPRRCANICMWVMMVHIMHRKSRLPLCESRTMHWSQFGYSIQLAIQSSISACFHKTTKRKLYNAWHKSSHLWRQCEDIHMLHTLLHCTTTLCGRSHSWNHPSVRQHHQRQ